ncbi:DEAD/DEAH box helicase [Chloroflexota bacterium]
MINLKYIQNKLILEPEQETDIGLIQQPLHRIYLKSSLKSSLSGTQYYWNNLGSEQLSIIVQNLIEHFERYKIDISIDTNCQMILDYKKRDEEDFKELVKRGRESKRKLLKKNRDQIRKILADGFKRNLKDFQLDGIYHLSVIGNGANFSVPGSGKTSIALAYYHMLRIIEKIDAILIIGPASCFEPWEHEYSLCFGKEPNSVRIAGFSKVRRNELYLLADKFDIILTTYHSAVRDANQIIECLKRRKYLLVLDESHYIKRPQGGKISETVLKLAKYGKYKVILTGTPMPNNLEDLWSQFAFLWDTKSPLGRVDNYIKEIRRNSIKSSIESVKKKIEPFFFRVTKQQLKLPPVVFENITCELSPLQKRIYEGVATQFLSQLKEEPQDKEAIREWRRARAIRLLQVASNPTLLRQQCEEFSLPPMDLGGFSLKHGIEYYAKFEVPGKFMELQTIVKGICDKGNKLIIWTSFIHNLTMLYSLFESYSPVTIHGSVPISSTDHEELTREKLISQFKNSDKCRILLANPAACAESISLHDVCHHAIYLDRTFNCAHYLQSLDRIHRIGLIPSQITHYYLMYANDTIDSIVDDRLKEKMINMGNILEDDLPGIVPGYWINQLGDEELVDLVRWTPFLGQDRGNVKVGSRYPPRIWY